MADLLVQIPIVLYLLGWLAELIQHARRATTLAWAGGVLAIGWGAHTLLLAVDLVQYRLSLPNLLSVAAWLAMILYYLARRRPGQALLRFVFPPFAVALMLTAAFVAQRMLLPAGNLDRI